MYVLYILLLFFVQRVDLNFRRMRYIKINVIIILHILTSGILDEERVLQQQGNWLLQDRETRACRKEPNDR